MRINHGTYIFIFILAVCCGNELSKTSSVEQPTVITIDIDNKKQIIRSFGASDAWACQYVGTWPDEQRKKVVDWLFSKTLDANGRPIGIGLSLWRFNIGAGSDTQNDIPDPWRRAEGFLQADGTYDWTKQQGQQWFLQEAKQAGVEHTLAFTNSPPVQLTKNGKAFSSSGTEANLASDKHDDFAIFLVDVLHHFKSRNLEFDYISPFNEPQWDWTNNKQEGTPFTNAEIFSVTKILDSLLDQSDVRTKIQIPEAAKLNYLFEKADKATRGNQVGEFYRRESPFYIGDFKSVDRVISGHSYFTSHPPLLYLTRSRLAEAVSQAAVPVEFWQSEYCLLGEQEEVNPKGKDFGIDPALYVARIIHHDLTVANASSWSWWLAVSPYDYKDGLIYSERSSSGNIKDSKMLWALGNFSRFIRPGAQRVEVTSTANVNDAKGLMVSSYLNKDGELVIVAINYSNTDAAVDFRLKSGALTPVKYFITASAGDENLKPVNLKQNRKARVIPARSIVTITGALNEAGRKN